MFKPAIIGLVGFILIGLGIAALLFVPEFLQKSIQKKLVLIEGSKAFKLWEKVPLPIYNRFYFFNVTNAQAIEREGAKPILKQIGPFTYRVSVAKFAVRNNDNGTLSYRERKSWHFERSLSITDENQLITTLNTPLALTLTLIQGASPTVRVLVTLALDAVTEGFFIKRTVRQLLFEGYPDLLTTFGPLLNPGIPSNNGRFGYMFPKNNTDDGLYTIFSGSSNINLLNMIERYNGRDHLNFWSTEECNSLNGSTNGQLGPPLVHNDGLGHGHHIKQLLQQQQQYNAYQTNENAEVNQDYNPNEQFYEQPPYIKLFASEICRVLHLRYNTTHEPYPDLPVHRYTFDETNFASAADYPPNECYISKLPDPAPSLLYSLARNPPSSSLSSTLSSLTSPSSGGLSSPSTSSAPSSPLSPPGGSTLILRPRREPFASGVFDLSACRFGAPLLLSQPHFLNSHPIYRNSVEGLAPNDSKHSFWMDIEPLTGSTVNMAARFQLNVAISKAPGLFRYRNIPDIVFPVFWQEYHFEFTKDLAQQLIDLRSMPYLVSSISFYSFLSIGIILLIISVLVYALPFLKIHNLEINGKPIQANLNTLTKAPIEDDREVLSRKASSNCSGDGIDNQGNHSTC
ncbi:scavenger receptor class B member 1 [Tetranychus urticae]|uniref:Scavenger receptor class B member 1 n=1 Tax=Tetranychus urticae TaxID=32264 RepID=T1KCW8_TETUR|nr:scavenger receptor class B member 1 [Tetranychus urticae]